MDEQAELDKRIVESVIRLDKRFDCIDEKIRRNSNRTLLNSIGIVGVGIAYLIRLLG